MDMKSGQVLILVLLTVIVVLTIGLSVASRNITNLRTTTQTEQSQRAFTAAEGGVEDVLSIIDDPVEFQRTYRYAQSSTGDTQSVAVGDLNATVNVRASATFDGSVSVGDVLQIDLEGVRNNQTINIEWARKNTVEVDPPHGVASIEVTQIYSISGQDREYFQGEPRAGESGNVVVASDCSGGSAFKKCMSITTPPAPAVPKLLRIKPFWANTTVRVYGNGFDLPVQIYDITSTAQSEIGVARSVQVTRSSKPKLPAVFDYVLFSEQDIVK